MELAKARTLSSIERTANKSHDDDILSNSFEKEDQEWTMIEDSASGSISPGSWKPKDG
jgi:hypothetical protein